MNSYLWLRLKDGDRFIGDLLPGCHGLAGSGASSRDRNAEGRSARIEGRKVNVLFVGFNVIWHPHLGDYFRIMN